MQTATKAAIMTSRVMLAHRKAFFSRGGLFSLQRLDLLHVETGGDRIIGAQHGFHYPAGDKGAYDSHHEGGGDHKVPVGGDGHCVAGVQDLRRLLGSAAYQGINVRQHDVGGQAAVNGGKGHHHAGDGVALIAQENHGGQGQHDQRGSGVNNVAAYADEDNRGVDQFAGSDPDKALNSQSQIAGAVGHGDTEEHDQGNAQCGVVDEQLDHVVQDIGDTLSGEQRGDHDRLLLNSACGAVVHHTGGTPAKHRADMGNDQDKNA